MTARQIGDDHVEDAGFPGPHNLADQHIAAQHENGDLGVPGDGEVVLDQDPLGFAAFSAGGFGESRGEWRGFDAGGPQHGAGVVAGLLAGLVADEYAVLVDVGDVGALIGFAEVGPSRDDDAAAGTGELIALHVTQSRWRQGAGRALHDTAMATLADRGFQVVTLWVLTGKHQSTNFYQAMG